MPAYMFSCEAHGAFSVWQKMNDEHKAKCPHCSNEGMRVFFPPGLGGDLPSKKRHDDEIKKKMVNWEPPREEEKRRDYPSVVEQVESEPNMPSWRVRR